VHFLLRDSNRSIVLKLVWNPFFLVFSIMTAERAQWTEYSRIAHEVAGSLSALYKYFCARTCLFGLGTGVFYV
jgi:hypothetical protein